MFVFVYSILSIYICLVFCPSVVKFDIKFGFDSDVI